VHRNTVTHEFLMRESTDRVQKALYSDNPNEQLVASRLLESPAAFRIWESEHSGLMREVATGFRRTQAALLKKAAFRLIHRKALFEYLRDERVRGSARLRLVATFHPTQDYTRLDRDVGGAVLVRRLERVAHLARCRQRQALAGHRRSAHVAAQAFELLALIASGIQCG
jgi:hypothetical protein